jgi:hypothetical protein
MAKNIGAKNIGVLAAVAFVISTQGVTAATIPEARLQELMASTSLQEVSLETLRARDRNILEELARSLASRYSDVLAGSEMVFTRLSESGSLFYRLDFVGLKNEDRARALCEILEMDRCIARIGDDRLRVLNVETDPLVSAIAVVEDSKDTEPFDWVDADPVPAPNPQAGEIQARVRNALDPLGVYPEPRPDLEAFIEAVDAPVQSAPHQPDQDQPVRPGPAEDRAAPDQVPEQIEEEKTASLGIYPVPRPFVDLAQFEVHPVPLSRPLERLAALMAEDAVQEPETAAVQVALAPKAESFGLQHDETQSVKMEAAVRQAANVRSKSSALLSGMSGMGDFMGGYLEVADAGVAPIVIPAPQRAEDAVVRLPGIGEVDMAKVQAAAPQIEMARAVLPGVSSARSTTAMSRIFPTQPAAKPAVQPAVKSSVKPAAAPAPAKVAVPTPFSREVALADLEVREQERAMAKAMSAGEVAPKPVRRELALREIAPAPTVVARVEAPSIDEVDVASKALKPATFEAPVHLASAAKIDAPLHQSGDALVAPQAPKLPEPVMAKADPSPAKVLAPRRLIIKVPEDAEKDPVVASVAESDPVLKAEPKADREVSVAALKAARETTQVARLGAVSFDDRYAQPAAVDFNDGHVAGRLQKLPFHRPDLSEYVHDANHKAVPLREAGIRDSLAMVSTQDASFEIAQVPVELPTTDLDEDDSLPFEMTSESESATSASDMLDRLLSQGTQDTSEPEIEGLDFTSSDEGSEAEGDVGAIFGGEASPSRPGLNAQAALSRPTLPGSRPGASMPQATQETLLLTPQMRREGPEVRTQKQAPVAAVPENVQTADTSSSVSESLNKVSEDRAAAASAKEDMAARQRLALEALSQIVEDRQATKTQTAAPQTTTSPAISAPQVQVAQAEPAATGTLRSTTFAQPQGTMQRRAMPSAPLKGNMDVSAAQEIASYQASFRDNRTDMQQAADPYGQVSPAELLQRKTSLSETRNTTAPSDLRIELSYVGTREEVIARVEELKGFFPPMMMSKGRFFGASVPGQSNRYVVGIAATDLQDRDDLIWYLEQMGLPWAIR